jgi:hypothetical protein
MFICNLLQFSIKWAKVNLKYVAKLYLLDQVDACWGALFDYFVDIKDYNLKPPAKDFESELELQRHD